MASSPVANTSDQAGSTLWVLLSSYSVAGIFLPFPAKDLKIFLKIMSSRMSGEGPTGTQAALSSEVKPASSFLPACLLGHVVYFLYSVLKTFPQ